jgi:hypothetical protein
MWRDEAQAWQIARTAHSLPELFHNLRYEGHPALWHLILFGFSKIFVAINTMQYISIAFATGTAFLVLQYATFNRAFRLAFIFGYYLFFEYNMI